MLLCTLTCGLMAHTTSFSKSDVSDIIDSMVNDLQEMENIMLRTCHHTARMIESFSEIMNENDAEESEYEDTEPFIHKKLQPRINITMKETDQQKLTISCKGIVADNVKTTPVTKNLFSIQTPTTDILIKVKQNIITITAEHEKTEDIEKNQNHLQSFSHSKARIKQYIEQPVNLSATTIDYNKDEKNLLITIPYAEKEEQNQILK